MKRFTILAAIAALVLGACTKTEINYQQTEGDAVAFGAYSGRSVTKAGPTDDMNLDALKQHGFGVFATYTATTGFDAFGGATNDFMYNQKVYWADLNGDATTTWEYTPVKYWPNPTAGQSKTDQKVSFFAYAPYADPEATGADNSYGITGFATTDVSGVKHNFVNYAFHPTKPNVDLMWGFETGTDPKAANLDKTRTASTVNFTFRHLLAKLGGSQEREPKDPEAAGYVADGLMIKANPTADPTVEYNVNTVGDFGGAKGTKITVSKIVVESAPADGTLTDANGNVVSYATAAQTGKLDLYTGAFTLDSTTPQAIQFSQTLSANATEVAAGASEISDLLKEPASVSAFADLPKGVTKNAVNVYKDESNPIVLVPGTAPVVNVTITYTVRTYDEKIPTTGYSQVAQEVFGQVKFPTIEANKKYNLLIIVGLNDVKFAATVEDWTAGGTWVDANGNGVVDAGELTGTAQEIELPANL